MPKYQSKKTGNIRPSRTRNSPGQFLRPPIVCVLGHVDHGKTTLLDKIRDTKVAEKEVGGITQRIGASQVTTKGGKEITFIDTPGHAAFANMRSQGAKVADIAVLVVAGDDGVKPQTKEALEYILAEKIPFLVAVSKIDLETASLETVRTQLEEEQVLFEGRGGDVCLLGVSGKTGKGIDELLEMICLISELNEVKADPASELEAVVIETGKDKRGPLVSLVVRNGSLKVRDEVMTVTSQARVRGLFDHLGKRVEKVTPGEPALILGFSQLPQVGERLWHKKEGEISPQVIARKPIRQKTDKGKVPLVLKAKNAGALKAATANLPEEFVVVDSGVGEINESDVFMAKSAGADIFAFESQAPKEVVKLAETEGVDLHSFDIIYELFEKLEEVLRKGELTILGRAEIVKSFPFNKKRVAGCKVIEGSITQGNEVVIKRGTEELGGARIVSMRKEKVNIEEAKQGEEFGVIFTPQLEFKEGDMILSVRRQD